MATVRSRITRIRDGLTPREWLKVGGMALTIIGLNVLGWGMLVAAVRGHYQISKTEVFGFGTGVLAYTLGMRHAFDADHIAAIDNTTRKLIQDGKRPLSVGYFFSLGHSSIVFVARRPAELRHPGSERRRQERRLGPAPLDRRSSARRCRAPSCT